MSITPNNYISPFIAKKASIPQTSKFLNKVGDNAQTTDTREVGAASKFKDVLNDTRVTVQFENQSELPTPKRAEALYRPNCTSYF